MGLVEERAFGVEDKRVAEVAEQEAIFLCFSTKAKASLTNSLSLSLSLCEFGFGKCCLNGR